MPRRPRAHLDNVPRHIVQRGHNRELCLFGEADFQVETYLLSRQRYNELDPVPASPVDDPAHYRWTSYRRNALGQYGDCLTPRLLHRSLGKEETGRQAAYRKLFQAR